jgi:hypothetical protein
MNLVEKGPTFELYKGAGSALRMDWTHRGALRCTCLGQVEGSSAEVIAQRLDKMRASGLIAAVIYDFWEAHGLDSQFRVSFLGWSKRHPGALASVDALSRSKVVNTTLSVLALALPGLKFNIHPKRADFDLVCRKLGLPTNVSVS